MHFYSARLNLFSTPNIQKHAGLMQFSEFNLHNSTLFLTSHSKSSARRPHNHHSRLWNHIFSDLMIMHFLFNSLITISFPILITISLNLKKCFLHMHATCLNLVVACGIMQISDYSSNNTKSITRKASISSSGS